MARIAFQNKCPKCRDVKHERIYRKWWMHLIPGTKYYSCNRCRSKFMIIFWRSSLKIHRKELSMKERRQHNRFASHLSARLEAITSGRKNVLYIETKDISATGAFLYTKKFFPKGTQFILDFTIPSNSNKELENVKILKGWTGSMVRSTSHGMAIHFDRECHIMSLRSS
jgi:hypothetical protein